MLIQLENLEKKKFFFSEIGFLFSSTACKLLFICFFLWQGPLLGCQTIEKGLFRCETYVSFNIRLYKTALYILFRVKTFANFLIGHLVKTYSEIWMLSMKALVDFTLCTCNTSPSGNRILIKANRYFRLSFISSFSLMALVLSMPSRSANSDLKFEKKKKSLLFFFHIVCYLMFSWVY